MEYYKQLHANQLDNFGEMDKFLKAKTKNISLPKQTQEELENLKISTVSKETELVNKTTFTKKSPSSDGFAGESYQTLIFSQTLPKK